MDFSDEIPGFLIESNENLAQLDLEMVELERNPENEALVASVFRTIHTLKGTSGFFGFEVLGSVAHVAENILGQVREKQRSMTPDLVSLILETVDAVRIILTEVENTGREGEDRYHALRARLETAFPEGATQEEGALQDGAEPRSGSAEAGMLPAPEVMLAEATSHDAATATERVVEERLVEERVVAARLVEERLVEERGRHDGVEARSQPFERRAPRDGSGEAAPVTASVGDSPAAADAPQYNRRAEDRGVSTSTIRVDVSLLDKLMNLVGELVLARNQILQGAAPASAASATAQRLNLITSELQEGVMRTRMQPIAGVWNKLPRVVRDLASELGKKIEIQMEGAETELDKTIIEAIKDPLTHIVRNSCDHGVERPEVRTAKGKDATGIISLRAFHEGGHVNIEIADDGAGIDPERVKAKAVQKGLIRPEQAAGLSEWEALRLIFLPGFSTAEKVTGISGRGVGMDVVKTNIEKISGTVDMLNRPGGGTTIKIKIPLTLAIIPGLIVSVRQGKTGSAQPSDQTPTQPPVQHRFVVPQANLVELVRLEGDKSRTQIEKIHGIEVYRRRGKLLPLAHLSEILGLGSPRVEDQVRNIIVVKAEETAFGLVVDEVNDTQEIVVKALGKQLKGLTCYVGATIMGDGKIALILDVAGIAKLAKMQAHPLERARSDQAGEARSNQAQQLLLFRAGRFGRLVLDLSLVARLEEISRARLEYAGGSPVVRYRDAILPLVSLTSLLDPAHGPDGMEAESLQVIVFNEGNRYVGLVVDEILDIIDDAATVKQPCVTFGLLGSGVIAGKVTDFVDLEAILEAARSHPAAQLPGPSRGGTGRAAGQPGLASPAGLRLILIDGNKLMRGGLRSFLEMHGHEVVESATIQQASTLLERSRVDVILCSVELASGEPASGGAEPGAAGNAHLDRGEGQHRFGALMQQPAFSATPVIGLAPARGAGSPGGGHWPGVFDQVVLRTDRAGLLEAIAMLTSIDREPAPEEQGDAQTGGTRSPSTGQATLRSSDQPAPVGYERELVGAR